MQTSINLTEYYLKKRKMNNKTFNLEILEPIDFENPFIIESLIKERMLNHLDGEYHIQSREWVPGPPVATATGG